MNSAYYPAGGKLHPLSSTEDINFGRGAEPVLDALRHCPAYNATPLRSLCGAAGELGLAKLWVKDETARFGMDSFKALGGVYAVLSLAADRAGVDLQQCKDLAPLRKAAARLVVCAATDGNHGRAVAAGARLVGARCVIFIHEHVAQSRRELLVSTGAQLEVVAGHYDDAVAACNKAAARNGWQLVADVASAGEDPAIPTLVSRGYLAIAHEILLQLGEQIPTHVFIQAGVGGLAAALVAGMADFGWLDTRVIVVEPRVAACLRCAAETGRPAMVPGDIDSIMGMLSCGIVSEAAWPILRDRVFGYLSLEDNEAIPACRWLRHHGGSPPLAVGPSGAAGLAGLLRAVVHQDIRTAIGLDRQSRALVVATEADVDNVLDGSD